MAIQDGYSICFNSWALDTKIKNELNLLLIISSLTAENGYCFASNKYFSDLFGIDEISVSRKIKKLENLGYITVEYTKRGCEVIDRKIRLTKMLIDGLQKNQSTINKNVKDNNINNNNINNNIGGKFTPPTFEEVKEYFSSRNLDEIWAKKFYDYYTTGNWIDGKGKRIKNWKQKVIAVWDKQEYKVVPPEIEAKREENAIQNNYWIENSSKVNSLRTGELLMVNILYILRDKADKGDSFAQKIIDTMRTSELTDEQLEKIKNYIISVKN